LFSFRGFRLKKSYSRVTSVLVARLKSVIHCGSNRWVLTPITLSKTQNGEGDARITSQRL